MLLSTNQARKSPDTSFAEYTVLRSHTDEETMNTNSQPPGWYNAAGDPQGTVRYWDGAQWQGGPQSADAPRPYDNSGQSSGDIKNRLADPWLRLGARIIDGLILLIPALIIFAIPLGFLLRSSETVSSGVIEVTVTSGPNYFTLAIIGVNILVLGYEYFFLEKEGATPGKKILGLQVIRETGEEKLTSEIVIQRLLISAAIAFISFVGAFIGFISVLGSLLSFGVGIATVVMIFSDDLRQVPNDKIAKTVVIKT